MRSFNEYHDVSFKGMEKKEGLEEQGIFPMGLLVDMKKLREVIGEPCPECGETALVVDRIVFERSWDTVEGFHSGVNYDHILLGGLYTVVCGEEGCDFEFEESIPVELYNRKGESSVLIIETDLSPEEVEEIEKDDQEYCEENDIEYCEEDLGTVVDYYP